MTAFNFKPEFVPMIESGHKRSTIRSTRRCSPGGIMQLYTGQRTKSCRKIMDVRCIGVAEIEINDSDIWRLPNPAEGKVFVNPRLAHQEGFQNEVDMLAFFRTKYGLPYRGWLHVWGAL